MAVAQYCVPLMLMQMAPLFTAFATTLVAVLDAVVAVATIDPGTTPTEGTSDAASPVAERMAERTALPRPAAPPSAVIAVS